MIFDKTRDMFEVARNFTHFFAHESCGFCTPCRVGTTLLCNAMDKLAERGSLHDVARIERIDRLLQASLALRARAHGVQPAARQLKRFRPAYERRLLSTQFEPAFDLDAALARARAMTGRDDAGAHFGADD